MISACEVKVEDGNLVFTKIKHKSSNQSNRYRFSNQGTQNPPKLPDLSNIYGPDGKMIPPKIIPIEPPRKPANQNQNKNTNSGIPGIRNDLSVIIDENLIFDSKEDELYKNEIEQIFKDHSDEIIDCYKEVRVKTKISLGEILILVKVDKNGKVTKVTNRMEFFKNKMFACVKPKIMKWDFGKRDKDITFKKYWGYTPMMK